ncbi:glycosyltransferase [Candidatus Woesearchaeota archaeon]|nr:glycosyltransferase [Candidatus Woesearchaeota archaeon]
MKKILFVIDRLNEGAGRVVYDIVKKLDKKKFEPVVASVYKGGNLADIFNKLGVKIICLSKKKGAGFGLFFRLRKLIKKEKINIVHTHNVDAYEYGILAAKLAGVKDIIHTAHGKSVKIGRFRRSRESIYHKFVSSFLDRYIVVSKDLGRYVVKNWCSGRKKIKLIYNGIDANEYKKIKVSKDFLYGLGVRKNDKVIGIVAGLRPVKDHITLIKAMKIVKEEIPNSKLLAVGDGPEKRRLVNFALETGLDKDVLFLGNRKDTVELYNCFDVGILSSLSECLSITLLEGMACETPFIATAVGGNPEVIQNGEDGFLVAPKNPKLMAEMIIQVLKSKKLREETGRKAREKIVREFNIERMVKNYEGIYNG